MPAIETTRWRVWMDYQYDVIVIGSGPGGEGAAMKAIKAGLKVAVVERYVQVGGSCTHWGTIPSKSLRHAIQRVCEFREDPLLRGMCKALPSFPDLLSTASSVIQKQARLRQGFHERNGVDLIEGHACFIDEHTVEVTGALGLVERISAAYFIIATGSRPYHPPFIDFNHPRVFDADTILTLDRTPQSILIYGAGVIGCEYASIFRNLQIKVGLINTRDRLLEFLDDEIVDALAYHLREKGVRVRHSESASRLEANDERIILHLKSGKRIQADVLLWANGRSGNTHNLGLEVIGLKPNHRGQLDVDSHYRTALPHIYAVGDVIGWPGLASAAYDQGRFAAGHVISGADSAPIRDIPTGIYTTPEISSVGRTERELTEQKVPYEVGHAFFRTLARAQITGQTVGMLKILFHADTLEILGIHCFGDQASEIVHIGQAIMSQPGEANTLMYFVNTTFNYPTMAEAYRVAALNGLNRLVDL